MSAGHWLAVAVTLNTAVTARLVYRAARVERALLLLGDAHAALHKAWVRMGTIARAARPADTGLLSNSDTTGP